MKLQIYQIFLNAYYNVTFGIFYLLSDKFDNWLGTKV